MYYYHDYHSPLGKLTIASNEKNIVGLWLEGVDISNLFVSIPQMICCTDKEM